MAAVFHTSALPTCFVFQVFRPISSARPDAMSVGAALARLLNALHRARSLRAIVRGQCCRDEWGITRARSRRRVKHLKHETSTKHRCAATIGLQMTNCEAGPSAAHTGSVNVGDDGKIDHPQSPHSSSKAEVKPVICSLQVEGRSRYEAVAAIRSCPTAGSVVARRCGRGRASAPPKGRRVGSGLACSSIPHDLCAPSSFFDRTRDERKCPSRRTPRQLPASRASRP